MSGKKWRAANGKFLDFIVAVGLCLGMPSLWAAESVIYLSGGADTIQFADGSFDSLKECTVEFWLRIESHVSRGQILLFGERPNSMGINFGQTSDLAYYFYRDGKLYTCRTQAILSRGEWYHVAA